MPSARKTWLAVAAAFVLNGGLFGAWASRIPSVVQQNAIDGGQLGLLLLLLALGAIVSFPLAGRASHGPGSSRCQPRCVARATFLPRRRRFPTRPGGPEYYVKG